MKKFILLTLASLLSCGYSFSQDSITKKNGDDIQAKVIEVGSSEIKYKKFDNLEGPVFTIPKADVLLVRYQNGSKDIFTEETKTVNSAPSATEYYSHGQADASKYYQGYTGAGTGTLITGLLSPLVGLIPAVACSSAQPKDFNLDYPDPELMKNPDYYQGYVKKARKIKSGKVWKNWGIAFGVNVVAVILLSSSDQ